MPGRAGERPGPCLPRTPVSLPVSDLPGRSLLPFLPRWLSCLRMHGQPELRGSAAPSQSRIAMLLRLSSPSAEWGWVMHLQRSWRTLVRCLRTFGREVPTVRPAVLLTISSTYDGREGITPEQHNTLHLNYSSSSSTNVIAEISHHVSLSIPFIPNDSEHVNCI